MKDGIISGVGLLLFSQNRIITVRELTDKPAIHKKAGMLSFPLETVKGVDRNPLDTIIRLLREELGIFSNEVDIWGIAPNTFQLIPGRTDIQTLYGVGTFLGYPDKVFEPEDTDVEFAGWQTPEQLLSQPSIRVEVAPILEHFSTQTRAHFT